MMQAAEPGHRHRFATDVSIHLRQPTRWSSLLQHEMRPVQLEVVDVIPHQPLQMAFVQRDDVIEQVSPAVPSPAFRYAFLSLACKRIVVGL